MKRAISILSVLALLIFTSAVALADDVCNDINGLANGWNEVANLVHQYGDQLDTLPEADSAALIEAIGALSEATGLLVDLLEQGDETERTLAAAIDIHMAILINLSETNAEVVEAVDGVVDGIDLVTDYCDAQTAE